MSASFLITLREGLEVSLVLAILLGYLAKSGRAERSPAVWAGAGSAALVCIVAGIAFNFAIGEFEGRTEQAIEGILAAAAASVLTWMILWMRKNAGAIGSELRAKVDEAVTGSALALIAFVAVAREGFETVLFLVGAEHGNDSAAQVVIGGVSGLVVSAVLGVLVYRFGKHIDLRSFFRVTGVLLIFFAAGLAGKAFHEFRELFGVESGWLIEPMWTITSGSFAKGSGSTYDFLNGLFGWASDPERGRVLVYFAYLVPVLLMFMKPQRRMVVATAH